MQSLGDMQFIQAQQAGYRKGELFDCINQDMAQGLMEAFKMNGYSRSDIRHYAFAVGFMHACADVLKARLAELKKCPHDTNGDGDCSRHLCPHCGK